MATSNAYLRIEYSWWGSGLVTEFDRIKGGKPFDVQQPWFADMLSQIGQKTHYSGNVRVAYGDVENVAARHP